MPRSRRENSPATEAPLPRTRGESTASGEARGVERSRLHARIRAVRQHAASGVCSELTAASFRSPAAFALVTSACSSAKATNESARPGKGDARGGPRELPGLQRGGEPAATPGAANHGEPVLGALRLFADRPHLLDLPVDLREAVLSRECLGALVATVDVTCDLGDDELFRERQRRFEESRPDAAPPRHSGRTRGATKPRPVSPRSVRPHPASSPPTCASSTVRPGFSIARSSRRSRSARPVAGACASAVTPRGRRR